MKANVIHITASICCCCVSTCVCANAEQHTNVTRLLSSVHLVAGEAQYLELLALVLVIQALRFERHRQIAQTGDN